MRTQVGQLLGEVLGLVRVIQDARVRAYSYLLLAIAQLESQEILNQILQGRLSEVDVCAGLEDTADRTIWIWRLWSVSRDEPGW